jgi:hypothetical protein
MLPVKSNHQKQLGMFMAPLTTSGLMSEPLVSVYKTKLNSEGFKILISLFPTTKELVTIGEVLTLTEERLAEVTGTFRNWKIPYTDVQAFRVFVRNLQQKLKGLGFSTKDGPFLSISFKCERIGPNCYARYRALKQQKQETVAA